jgi:hypothetical protein
VTALGQRAGPGAAVELRGSFFGPASGGSSRGGSSSGSVGRVVGVGPELCLQHGPQPFPALSVELGPAEQPAGSTWLADQYQAAVGVGPVGADLQLHRQERIGEDRERGPQVRRLQVQRQDHERRLQTLGRRGRFEADPGQFGRQLLQAAVGPPDPGLPDQTHRRRPR